MADRETSPSAKDPKQLKKEKKEQEKLAKEKEKREKKLEKERKKLEERERKRREKEAKAEQQKAQQTQQLSTSDLEAGRSAERIHAPSAGEDAATTQNGLRDDSAMPLPSSETGNQPATLSPAAPTTTDQLPADKKEEAASSSWPEKVTVSEAPGQISGFGNPIGIVFNTSLAGRGPLAASCRGGKTGDVGVSVTQLGGGLVSVKFTPNTADVYMLSVRWGEGQVPGSPFSINLSRLQPAGQETQPPPPQQKTEPMVTPAQKVNNLEDSLTDEEEDVSDDPFEMAFQASRMLEANRQTVPVPVISSEPPPSTRSPPKASAPGSSQATQQRAPPYPTNTTTHPTMMPPYPTQQQQGPPYPYNTTPSSVPYPPPVGTQHLQEVNKSLQEANEELGQEVEELKKKMGEFEEKLIHIEESSRAAEEERRELMANTGMRGWLHKRGIKGPTANVWRRRYFRCDQGSKIHYYKSSDETVPRGTIDLENVLNVEEVADDPETAADPDSSIRFGFNIVCAGRTYQLQADDEHMRKEWMSTFQYLKNWFQKNKSPRLAQQQAS